MGRGVPASVALAAYPTLFLPPEGPAEGAAEGAQVDLPARLRPRERMGSNVPLRAGNRTPADDLAAVVHSGGRAVCPAEGAEVDHPAPRRPREGMDGGVAGGRSLADHLPGVAHP